MEELEISLCGREMCHFVEKTRATIQSARMKRVSNGNFIDKSFQYCLSSEGQKVRKERVINAFSID